MEEEQGEGGQTDVNDTKDAEDDEDNESTGKDCSDNEASFSKEFYRNYGEQTPKFSETPMQDAIAEALFSWPRDNNGDKIFGLYLHHEDAEHTQVFCSEVLTNPTVVKFLNENYVLWGWDLKKEITPKNKWTSIYRLLVDKVGLTPATNIKTLSMDVLPALLTLYKSRYGIEILSFALGKSSVDEMMTLLHMTKKVHKTQIMLTRQREEESNVTTLPSYVERVSSMVQEKSKKTMKIIKKKPAAWSISLNSNYYSKLRELADEIREQQSKERKKESQWKQEISRAVRRGEDVQKIKQLKSQWDGDLKVHVSLQEMGGDVTCSLLSLAAYMGHTHLIPYLLENGLSVEEADSSDRTPLILAASRGHNATINKLLEHDANCLPMNPFGDTALNHAAYHGHVKCVDTLIKAALTATCNNPEQIAKTFGCSPIFNACAQGHEEVIEKLRVSGWSLTTKDGEGNTLLHTAVMGGSLSVVKYLVKSGLDIYKKNNSGQTPLDIAIQQSNYEVENFILKRSSGRLRSFERSTPLDTQANIRKQKELNRSTFAQFRKCIEENPSIDKLRSLLENEDPHLVNEKGHTLLHLMAKQNNFGDALSELTEEFGHHHTFTFKRETPLDIARKNITTFDPNYDMIQLLENHKCPQIEGTPEDLYEKLLKIISEGDDAIQASRLLCAGAPMEFFGDHTSSALYLAVTSARSRIVNLLLASGASITHRSDELNLLQQAWYSSNTTPKVFVAITLAFIEQLKRERDLLPRCKTKGLRGDLVKLIEMLEGDQAWEASWPEEAIKKEKILIRSMIRLTQFMVTAARANCPLIVSFLGWAGALPNFSHKRGTTPFHAAIKAGNLKLVEVMIRDLGASLYIPDTSGCLPKDMGQLPVDLREELELITYHRERKRLNHLVDQHNEESEKERLKVLLCVQEALFQYYKGDSVNNPDVIETASKLALLIASRMNLLQFLYLLLSVAHLPPDTIVDTVCGTTPLHEAAAHGKSGCVLYLLIALQNASNKANGASDTDKNTKDNKQVNRYSLLKTDRYGQTALHLAAMFGHKHTLDLLMEYVDPECQAALDSLKINTNFIGYLRRYTRYNEHQSERICPLDRRDETLTLKKLLHSMNIGMLPIDARKAKVNFSDEWDEAYRVREGVLREVGIIVAKARCSRSSYMAGREVKLKLVGSSKDGSKLFAPDEFDINVVISASECVRVSIENNKTPKCKIQGLIIDVQTVEPELQAASLAEDLYHAVEEVLTEYVFDERKLSLVPPGLKKTKVGVSLAMAWQGNQYPLLLVSVDLVPVLEVPWHDNSIITRPGLTPPGTYTMQLSGTTDGAWRCSFAQLEAQVLENLSDTERSIQLSAKMLLRNLKTEPWMPRKIKAFSTWWSGRAWKVPFPGGFCIKSAFFLVLEEKRREAGTCWKQNDTIQGVAEIFERMCEPGYEKKQSDEKKSQFDVILPRRMKAYFGGECEETKDASGAPIIASHLNKYLNHRNQRNLHWTLWWCCRWIRWRLTWMCRALIKIINSHFLNL